MVSIVLFMGTGLIGWQLTEPAEISGRWTGERWRDVSLSRVEDANGWFAGSFTDEANGRGALQLEWSRLQQRYNGRWKAGDELSGSLTLRLRGGELRGAVTVDSDSPAAPHMPRLREFAWQRAPGGLLQAQDPPRAERSTDAPTPVQSPGKGRLARWADGVRENARVERGELIAELSSLDPHEAYRLKQQVHAAARHVEAASELVMARERKLALAKTVVASFESQLKAYRQVKSQLVAAGKASVESAGSKVTAEKAVLAEFEAGLHQAKAEFERHKELFAQRVIPESKLQESERKFREATAKIKKAEALVQVALNDAAAKQNDEKAKESKAQVEIDYASTQLSKAQADVSQAETDAAAAKLELHKAEKGALELRAKLSRQARFAVVAPVAGVVKKRTKNTVVKEGDTICLLQPQGDEPETEKQAVDANRAPAGVGVTGLLGPSARQIAETLAASSALGSRFRELRSKLQGAKESGASPSSIAALKADLAAAELERETAAAILKAQLDAAKGLNDSQSKLSAMVKRQIENGDLNPYTLPPAEQAVAATAAEIRQFELLHEYYTGLGNGNLTAAETEQNMAIEVLKIRLEAARKFLRFQANHSKLTRRRFELGDLQVQDVLQAEQAEVSSEAEVRQFEALLQYHEKLSKNNAGPRAKSQSIQEQ